MTQKLKVGIIGMGEIAIAAHLPNYLKLTDSVEVVAVADCIEEKAKSISRKYSIPHYFDSHVKMLENIRLDAVSVCVPNKFHFECVMDALDKDCHVLCEKPPAMNAKQASLMSKKAKEKNKILTYGFHYRFSTEVKTLKKFIDAGELGHIYSAKIRYVRRRGIPSWGLFTNKELQGGGALIDLGIHILDTALYLMGYPTPSVVLGSIYQMHGNKPGIGYYGKWDWENFSVEDMAVGMIRFNNDASLLIETSFAANIEKIEEKQITLIGDKGGADVFPLKLYQEKYDTLVDTVPIPMYSCDKREELIKNFVAKCLKENNDFNSDEGILLHKIIDALYLSANSDDAVKL